MSRRGSAVLVPLILLAFPAGSPAARLGPDLQDRYATGDVVCVAAPHCTRAQTKLKGELMRAPFSGGITSWRVMQPYGTFWPQVLRRRQDGSFKALRSGTHRTELNSMDGEVFDFAESLRIRKGDFVGVATDDFYASSFGVFDAVGQGYCSKGLVPGLDDGDSAQPNPSYGGCGALLLYNATVKH